MAPVFKWGQAFGGFWLMFTEGADMMAYFRVSEDLGSWELAMLLQIFKRFNAIQRQELVDIFGPSSQPPGECPWIVMAEGN